MQLKFWVLVTKLFLYTKVVIISSIVDIYLRIDLYFSGVYIYWTDLKKILQLR